MTCHPLEQCLVNVFFFFLSLQRWVKDARNPNFFLLSLPGQSTCWDDSDNCLLRAYSMITCNSNTHMAHSVITCRSWSQETRQIFPSVWPFTMNPLTFKVVLLAVCWLFSQHKSMTEVINCFCLFCSCWGFQYQTILLQLKLYFLFFSSPIFSTQSSEQKQTPVSPRASLPVQPQTRTTVSTPFLFFHLHI